jgi:hypothetical protein
MAGNYIQALDIIFTSYCLNEANEQMGFLLILAIYHGRENGRWRVFFYLIFALNRLE